MNPTDITVTLPNVSHIVGAYQSGKNKFYLRVVDGAVGQGQLRRGRAWWRCAQQVFSKNRSREVTAQRDSLVMPDAWTNRLSAKPYFLPWRMN